MRINFLLPLLIALCSVPLYVRTEDQLVQDFRAETDLVKKERLLNTIVRQHDAGSALLRVAMRTDDIVTRWMSIRGIGMVRYRKAVPFLIESLTHQSPAVRASAARALGEIGTRSASTVLIRLLRDEKDGGVVEQTALALWMLDAREAIPTLKRVADHPSTQTRCWILQAIGNLGTKVDIPFLAEHLYDPDHSVCRQAASAIEKLTGEDFGLPKGSGPIDPQQGLMRARRWWEKNKTLFEGGSIRGKATQQWHAADAHWQVSHTRLVPCGGSCAPLMPNVMLLRGAK